jgi:hypothetical protein
VVVDYDFQLGRNHLKGSGWRGLTALSIVVALRAGIIVIFAVSARPVGAQLIQLLQRLLGT